MRNKQKIIIAVVVILVVGGIVFWYSQNRKGTSTAPATTTSPSVTQEAGGTIGATIFEKTQDPLKTKIPETNPLKRVMINPF